MVTARLQGGLGNQMFQYAAATAVARHHGTRVRLDAAYIGLEPTERHFAMGGQRIEAKLAGRRAVSQRVLDDPLLEERRIRRRFRGQPVWEKDHSWNDALDTAPANAYLIGYWQSERYITGIADLLRAHFQPRRLSGEARVMAERIGDAANTVAVHVRRGDYVKDAGVHDRHRPCGQDYYQRAIEQVAEQVPGARYFVFSDDPEWCDLHLSPPGETVVVSGSTAAHEDIHLMTLCRHNVIANSSFSWWGAWLGERPDSVVVAPAHWFGNMQRDTSDQVPPRWRRIEAGAPPPVA